MKQKISILSVVALACTLLSCGGARQASQLAYHQSMLARVAASEMPAEEKMDSMATSFIAMMNEGLRIINPKKGAAYVEKYANANEGAIDQILKEVGGWQKEMNTVEKIGFGVSMVRKPYAKDMVSLVRKFEQKYRQVKFIMGLTKKVKSGLLSAGLKGLLN